MAAKPLYTITCSGAIQVDVGSMRHQLTVLQLQAASPPVYDPSGQVKTYQPYLPAMLGAIEVLRGTDVIRAGLITTQVFLTIMIWYQSGILPNMRILNNDNGSTYVVQSINNVLERNEVLLLNCIGLGLNE